MHSIVHDYYIVDSVRVFLCCRGASVLDIKRISILPTVLLPKPDKYLSRCVTPAQDEPP